MEPSHAQTPEERHNRRVGLFLFAIYVAAYAAFVAITAFDYRLMGHTLGGGVNLAIVYGMGLIVGAFVIAVVYAYRAR